MTFKNNRAPFLYFVKLWASFRYRWSIQNSLQSRNTIWVNISFFPRVTWKYDRLPWNTIGLLFNANSRFVHHFIIISEFKLKLLSWNIQFGSKLVIFLTLKFDRWHKKTIRHLFCTTGSLLHYFVAICGFKLELQSGNAQIETKFVLTSVTLTFDLDLLHGHHW